MAGNSEVTYVIRLKDQMTKTLKKMGVSVKDLRNKLQKGLVAGLKAARMAMKAFAIAATAAVAAAGALSFAAFRMGQSFINAASAAEETRAKFGAVFKELTSEAEDMAEAMAEGLGRSQTEVMGFMARLQDTFVPMGIARDEAMTMSTALASLAYDLSAFNKEAGTAPEVFHQLSSAMIGSHETVYKFGVILNEATLKTKLLEMGAKKVNGAFTEQDKAMARLQIIIESTTDAHGVAIERMDGWAQSTERLTSKVQELREIMGTRLIASLQEVIANMGGMDVMIENIRVAFEFFTNILTQILIPTLGHMLHNFSKFVKALGGVEQAVIAVSEVVALMGKSFKVMWDSTKLVLYYFQQGLDTVKFVVLATWNVLKLLVGLIGQGFVTSLRIAIEGIGLLYQAFDKLVIFLKDSAIAVFQSLLNTLADVVEGVGSMLSWLGEFELIPQAIADAGVAASSAAYGLRDFSAAQEDIKGGESLFKDIGDSLDAFGDRLEPAQAMLHEFINETWEELGTVSTEFVDAIMEDVPAINELLGAIRENTADIGTDYEALAEKVRVAMSQLGSIEITSPEQRDAIKALEEQLARLQAPGESVQKSLEAAAEAGFTMGDAAEAMGEGVARFAKKAGTMSEQIADITEGSLNSFSKGMTDALMSVMDGSKSAGEAFKEFAASFLMDVSRMIIQALVLKAVKSALGIPLANGGVVAGGLGDLEAFANGGAIQGGLGRFVPVKGYATGGPIVNKPHVALIGEGQHNEAVVPLPDGRSIPVDLQGSPESQVNINIEAVDGASVDRMLFDRRDTLRSLIATAISESRTFRGAVARA